MAILLNGKTLSLKIKDELKEKIQTMFLDNQKNVPSLAVLMVGDNPASLVYVKNKQKSCEYVGIRSVVETLPSTASEKEIIEKIQELNQDDEINGILVQLPLPKGISTSNVLNAICPEKDVDGLTNINKGKLYSCEKAPAPCTPSGVVTLLKSYDIELEGKNVVIIGRSELVGRPLQIMLMQENATTIMCHSKTKNLKDICKIGDIVIVAIGKPKFITDEYIKDNAIVVDVGINRLENGLVGDVDFEKVKDKCEYITPVPGGVGPMTIVELLKNVLFCYELQHKQ